MNNEMNTAEQTVTKEAVNIDEIFGGTPTGADVITEEQSKPNIFSKPTSGPDMSFAYETPETKQSEEVVEETTEVPETTEETTEEETVETPVAAIPSYIAKKDSTADKLVNGVTDTYQEIDDFITKYGNVYIEIPLNDNWKVQHKNERGTTYTGVTYTKSVDFNCILFKKCAN